MLRTIRKLFGARQTPSTPIETLDTMLVYVRVKPDTTLANESSVDEHRAESRPTVSADSGMPVAVLPTAARPKPPRTAAQQAESSGALPNLEIFSATEIKLLRHVSCRNTDDLLRLTSVRLEKRLAQFAAADQHNLDAPPAPPLDRIRSIVRRGRWAVRFASHFAEMTPRESLLLRAIHRANRHALAQDSAGMIRRDLQRFALSSRGQQLVTLDQVPELPRIRNWIATARHGQKPTPDDHVSRALLARVPTLEDSLTDVPMVPR